MLRNAAHFSETPYITHTYIDERPAIYDPPAARSTPTHPCCPPTPRHASAHVNQRPTDP